MIPHLVLDTWSALTHKAPLVPGREQRRAGWLSPTDSRRLTAYMLLAAYRENVARHYLPTVDGDDHADHREYGDAELVVQQTMSAVLGDEQQIVVEGAEDEEADPAAVARQEWLREWADAERLPLKLMEAESDAVSYGDGVYVLAWSRSKRRVRVTTLDPGFYFPVLDDGLTDDYPAKVHLAWELEGDPERGIPKRLRRITYELGPIGARTEAQPTTLGRLRRLVTGEQGDPLPLHPGDTLDGEGRVTRRYAWNDEPSTVTCYLTDAEWNLDDLDGRDALNDLSLDRATFHTNEDGELLDRFDLQLDFLPVIHLPNTVAVRSHFGTSSLAKVLQLLDDIAATDTDLQAATSTTGSPPIGLSGADLPVDDDGRTGLTIAPGEVWNLGPDGKLSTVDTSPALAALGQRLEALLSRLSANARLPEAVLGRVSPADVPSGFAVALTFGPMQSMVRSMRLSRGEKYPLLLKMVQRMALAGGELDGAVLPAELTFGSYLPSDLDAVIERVRKLLTPPAAISLETAVQMLVEAGLPIEDASEEVERIESRAFELANALADATGDTEAVRAFLHLTGPGPDLTPAPPPGAIVLPPAPPGALPAVPDDTVPPEPPPSEP